VDTPQALYRDPVNLFVAAFIGSPAMNLVEATLDGDAVELGTTRITLAPGQRPDARGRVVLGIRPESFEDAAFADGSLPQLEADVAVVEDLGSDAHVIFPVDAPRVEAENVRPAPEEEALIAGDGAVFTARVHARTDARPGRPLRLAVDPAGFHWFDPETGASLRRRASSAADELVLRQALLLDAPLLEPRRQPGEGERDHEEDERDEGEDLERVNLAEPDRGDERQPLRL
jgi:multiple sugar transport system ATP-binding protein